MRKQTLIAVVLLLAVLLCGGCGGSAAQADLSWPDNENTAGVPRPTTQAAITQVIDENGLTNITYGDVPMAEAKVYLTQLKDAGFTEVESSTDIKETISYVADEKTPWHYCWVGFSGIDAPLLLKKTPFTRENPIITAQNGDAIQKAFKKIWIARGYSFKDRTNMTGALYSALSLFIDHEQDAQSPSARYFNRAVDYIKGNYFFYGLSVEQIADILGITRSYLYTVFKDVCGLSPKEYITTYRINQACILLVQSEMTITSISYSIGFEDNLYFSKVFHKHMGLSPSAYRREKNEKK